MSKRNKEIVLPHGSLERRVGFGALPKHIKLGEGSFDAACEMIKSSSRCPTHNMATLHDTMLTFNGPINNTLATQIFGDDVQILDFGKSDPGPDFVQTTLHHGEALTYFMVCAVGVHFEPAPRSFTVEGGSWSVGGAVPTTATTPPVVPDVWTPEDLASGALGAAFVAGASPLQTLVPATFEYGDEWQGLMFWHFARAYNFQWFISQKTTIANWLLRHIAFIPPNAQNGTGSSSEMLVTRAINEMNARYRTNGSTALFLKQNGIRKGIRTAGLPAGVTSPAPDILPNREDLVGVTFGGDEVGSSLLRDMRSNSEYMRLDTPFIIKPGVASGIQFAVADPVQQAEFLKLVSLTEGAAGNPPALITDDSAVIAAGNNGGAFEWSLDAVPVAALEHGFNQRATYKGGPWKVSVKLKGAELSADEYDSLCSDKNLRDAIARECHVCFQSACP